MLPAMLEHCASKPERMWVCTVRDAYEMVERPTSDHGDPTDG